MHVFLILPLLLALTPQQKQLIKMVKQGDIFAGDDLARSVCEIPEDKRKKEAEAVLKRLKKVDNKAKNLVVEGIEKCMPKEKPKAAEAKKDEEEPAEAEKKKEGKARRPATEGTDVADAEEGGENDGKRRPIVGVLDEAAGEDEGKGEQDEVQRKAEEAQRKNEEAKRKAEEAKLAAVEAKKAEKARKAEEKRLAAEARKAERARKAEEKRLAAEERKAKARAEKEERKRQREEERARKLSEAKQAKEEKIAVATETEIDDEVVEEGLASLDDEAEDEIPPLAALDEVEEEAAPVTASAAAVSSAPEALRSAMMSYGVGGGLAVVSSVGFLVALGAISIGTFQTAEIIDSAHGGEPDGNEIATTWLGAGTVALLGVAAGAAELAIGIMLMQSGSELVDQATGTQPASQD